MAQDEETGIDPVSTDGEGASPDELAARRRAGGSAKDRALQAEQDALDGKEPGTEEEDDGQIAFEVPEAGRKLSLGTIIPRGVPVTYKYKMTGKAIPNVRGGLIDPAETNGLLLVPYVVEDVDTKFTRNDDRSIKAATVYIILAPREVVNAASEEGGLLLKAAQDAAEAVAAKATAAG